MTKIIFCPPLQGHTASHETSNPSFQKKVTPSSRNGSNFSSFFNQSTMASLLSLYISSSFPSPLPPHRTFSSISPHGSTLQSSPRTTNSRRITTIPLSFRTSYRFTADHEDGDEKITGDFGFDEAVDLFNQGAYYDCHDVLEALWNEAEDPTRTLIHGILQCAVGLHHLFNRVCDFIISIFVWWYHIVAVCLFEFVSGLES